MGDVFIRDVTVQIRCHAAFIGSIIIRNTIGIPKTYLPGIGIARPLIKPGIIILGVYYIWSDVVKLGGTGLILTSLFIFGTALTVMYICREKALLTVLEE